MAVINPSPLRVLDEGVLQGVATSLDFVGTGVIATVVAGAGLVTITGGSGYNLIEDEGVPLAARTTIDFVGAGVTVTDVGGETQVSIPGAAGSTNIKQTEIDFGTIPVAEASFTIADADVSATSQLIGSVAYEAPTGKDLDEMEMDGLDLKFAPGTAEFTVYARGTDGYVADKFKINYLVGSILLALANCPLDLLAQALA